MSQKLLLKVLNGLQSGAEVALETGDYVIGSGAEDDLQLRDVSLKAGHARLRIGSEGAEIKAEAGDILLSNGGRLEAGEDRWMRLEPLAVFVLGTTRISVGPPEANWASISDDEEFRKSAQPGMRGGASAAQDEAAAGVTPEPEEASALELRLQAMGLPRGAAAIRAGTRLWKRHPSIAAGASSAVVALIFSFLVFDPFSSVAPSPAQRDPRADRAAIEKAVASLPFTDKVRVRQEVDGQIIVRGIIRDAAERRALLGALEATRAPFRPRLATSDAILAETRNLLGPYVSRVRFALREDGVLVLNGFIADPSAAAKTLELIRNQVAGPTDIDSTRLKTGADLVADVTRMARDEGIGSNVVFTLVRTDYLEATGAVPAGQVDAWVSVLINYGDLFSDKLPLRSLVQMVAAGETRPSETPGRPVIIGGSDGDGRVLDLQRLRTGRFSAADIFAQDGGSTAPFMTTKPPAAAIAPSPAAPAAAATPRLSLRPLPFENGGTDEGFADPMKVIERWASGATPADDAEKRRFSRLDRLLGRTTASPGDNIFKATLLARGTTQRPFDACREATPAEATELHKALVWLDLLSTVDGLSIKTLARETQLNVAEVMLAPQRAQDCLARVRNRDTAARVASSVFLGEASVNPDFVVYLSRDVQTGRLRLSGARTEFDNTYVVDAEGRFLRSGTSIDVYSRIWSIGETGLVVEKADGIEIQVYDRGLAWLSRRVYDAGAVRSDRAVP